MRDSSIESEGASEADDSGRLRTGIPGLDEVLLGGVLRGGSHLLLGRPGTGKTVACLQWLLEGRRTGEDVLYLTIGEPSAGLIRNVAGFEWDISEIPILDAVSFDFQDPEAQYRFLEPAEVEGARVWERLHDLTREHAPDRLVLDSLTNLRHLSVDDFQFRRQILALFTRLGSMGGTTWATFDAWEHERNSVVSMAVDTVIRMERVSSASRTVDLRSLRVEKMRGGDFLSGAHAMDITSRGIVVFPHRIEHAGDFELTGELLPSGVPEIDQMLHGGVPLGTTTLVTGPTGIGKSTTATSFVHQALRDGRRAAIYSFEEPASVFRPRSAGVGLGLDEFLESGALSFRFINPLEAYPDEFLADFRRAVHEEERSIVLIDSLRGYRQVMTEFGSELAHLKNLLTFAVTNECTVFLLYEMEKITGDLMATEIGMSHLVDNVLLLRYAEGRGRITRVMGCLKKRLGPFQPELREYEITADGLSVGGRLEHMEGILSGNSRILPGGRKDTEEG